MEAPPGTLASPAAAALPAPMSLPRALLRAARPHQWIKNLVIAGPLIFVREAWPHPEAWLRTFEAIGAFCLLAGATYLFNDLIDRAADQHHPRKRLRPIASGALPVPIARLAMCVMVAGGLAWCALLDSQPPLPFATVRGLYVYECGLAYLILTLLYSVWLKRVPFLDVILVALGFVIRAGTGAAVLQVPVSPWLLLCTFLLLLMVALGKRRWELESLADARAHRANLAEYSVPLIDQFLGISAAMTVMAYALYTFNTETVAGPWLMLTLPNVLYGVYRYLALISVHGEGGAPEEAILRDPPTLINIGLWVLLSAAILMLSPA